MKSKWQYVFLLPVMVFWHATIYIPYLTAKISKLFTGKSNCYFWAYEKWVKEGGAVMMVRSKYGWWVHVRHVSIFGEITEYIPFEEHRKQALPPALFNGRVKKYGQVHKQRCHKIIESL